MNHILDPCYGCQPYTNYKTICDKQMFYNLYISEKQKSEQIIQKLTNALIVSLIILKKSIIKS